MIICFTLCLLELLQLYSLDIQEPFSSGPEMNLDKRTKEQEN